MPAKYFKLGMVVIALTAFSLSGCKSKSETTGTPKEMLKELKNKRVPVNNPGGSGSPISFKAPIPEVSEQNLTQLASADNTERRRPKNQEFVEFTIAELSGKIAIGVEDGGKFVYNVAADEASPITPFQVAELKDDGKKVDQDNAEDQSNQTEMLMAANIANEEEIGQGDFESPTEKPEITNKIIEISASSYQAITHLSKNTIALLQENTIGRFKKSDDKTPPLASVPDIAPKDYSNKPSNQDIANISADLRQ